MDIPIYLSLVPLPGFDNEVLRLQGYSSVFHFFNGIWNTQDPRDSHKNGLNFGGFNSTVKGSNAKLYYIHNKYNILNHIFVGI